MSTIASLIISLRSSTGPFSADMRRHREDFTSLVNSVDAGATRMSGALKLFATFTGASLAANTLASAFRQLVLAPDQAIAAARRQANAETNLRAVIEATGGAAGRSASQMFAYASALQNATTFGDEAIIEFQGVLATFKNVSGTTFDLATKAALDMSTVMKTDLASVAVQLGKALNDPTEGISALTRVGVSFTAQQKSQIKAMQEVGDLAGAQAVILAELKGEFGGAAEAMARTPFGRLKQLANSFGDAVEQVGGILAGVGATFADAFDLRGSVASLQQLLASVGPSVQASAAEWGRSIREFGTAFSETAAPIIRQAFSWISANRGTIATLGQVAVGLAALSIGRRVIGGLVSQTMSWVDSLANASRLLTTLAGFAAKQPAASAAVTTGNTAGYAMTGANVTSLAIGEKSVGMFQKLSYEASRFMGTLRGAGLGAAIKDLSLFGTMAGVASNAVAALGSILSAAFSLPAAAIAAVAAAGVMLVGTFERMAAKGESFGRAWGETGAGWLRTFRLIDGQAKKSADRFVDLGRSAIATKNAAIAMMNAKSFGGFAHAAGESLKAQFAQLDDLKANGGDTRAIAGRAAEIARVMGQLTNPNGQGFDFKTSIAELESLRSSVGANVPQIDAALAKLRGQRAGDNAQRAVMASFDPMNNPSRVAALQSILDLTSKANEATERATVKDYAMQLRELADAAGGDFETQVRAAADAIGKMNAAQVAADVAKLTASLGEQVRMWGLEGSAADLARLKARGATDEQLATARSAARAMATLADAKKLMEISGGGGAVDTIRQYQEQLAKLRELFAGAGLSGQLQRAIDGLNASLNSKLAERAKSLIDALVTPAQKLKNDVREILELYNQGLLSAQQQAALIDKARSSLAGDVASKLQQGPGEAIAKGSIGDVQATYKAEQRTIAEEYAKRVVDEAKRQTALLQKVVSNTAGGGGGGGAGGVTLTVAQFN